MASRKLISTAKVARKMGVSRQRVHQIMAEQPTFPAPEISEPRLLLFSSAKVRKWALAHNYEWSGK
jgi:predicted DNA-binding transcriptional regulator AlpA